MQPSPRDVIAAARAGLGGVPRVRLGVRQEGRRILGFGRALRIVPVGEAWHLGVLLIGDDEVYATGEILRARAEAIRGYTAESQRARSERAAAAVRGGFAEGEAVHLDWSPVDLDAVAAGGSSGPLSLDDGVVTVAFAAGARMPLAAYLDDRIALLP
ncbi:glutaminase [Microbacterium radiodurans]|uniref:Glutaminase n=1 Tax=Microbacterium radiodurans TaxID=661398 RepID=A0A5J5ISS5_9MICO|nr:glutaminase [Microbacterium radiodurans]KAA9089053.1 glutaminase [Microbacterium radiodurans]